MYSYKLRQCCKFKNLPSIPLHTDVTTRWVVIPFIMNMIDTCSRYKIVAGSSFIQRNMRISNSEMCTKAKASTEHLTQLPDLAFILIYYGIQNIFCLSNCVASCDLSTDFWMESYQVNNEIPTHLREITPYAIRSRQMSTKFTFENLIWFFKSHLWKIN